MNWSNLTKTLLILLILCSCSQRNTSENSNTFSALEAISQNLQAKEPETFQGELILTTFSEDEPKERKIFIAKDRDKRFIKFGNKAWLELENKILLLDYRRKVLVEASKTDEERAFSTNMDSLSKMVIHEFLNKQLESKAQKISTEKGISKYLVTLENSNKSEIIVSYDEDKKIITEQEFFSVKDGSKQLLYKMELRNWSSDVSPENFKIPEGFRKISLEKF